MRVNSRRKVERRVMLKLRKPDNSHIHKHTDMLKMLELLVIINIIINIIIISVY